MSLFGHQSRLRLHPRNPSPTHIDPDGLPIQSKAWATRIWGPLMRGAEQKQVDDGFSRTPAFRDRMPSRATEKQEACDRVRGRQSTEPAESLQAGVNLARDGFRVG